MKIFVISLAGSDDRKARVKSQLNGAPFEFFDAINGHLGLPEDLENRNDDNYRRIFRSRPLAPGERGCYASHYRLWQKCVELDEPIVILEDDFKATKYFKNVLSHLDELAKSYDYVRLEPQYSDSFNLGFDEHVQKVLWKDNSKGVTGYFLTPEGAKKFLHGSKKWICSVDNFIAEFYLHGVPSVGVIPYAIYAPSDMGSSIQIGSEQQAIPLIFKLTRELNRFYRFLLMSYWNQRNLEKLKQSTDVVS